MKVQHSVAVDLFTGLKYKGPETWDEKKITKNINTLDKMVDDESLGELKPEQKTVYNQVIAAIAAKDPVEIEGFVVVEKKVKEKKEKKVPKETKAKPEVNGFGSRVGTKAADVDATLTNEPKKMKQIKEEAKVETTFYNHLNDLVNKELVENIEDYGFKLGKKHPDYQVFVPPPPPPPEPPAAEKKEGEAVGTSPNGTTEAPAKKVAKPKAAKKPVAEQPLVSTPAPAPEQKQEVEVVTA